MYQAENEKAKYIFLWYKRRMWTPGEPISHNNNSRLNVTLPHLWHASLQQQFIWNKTHKDPFSGTPNCFNYADILSCSAAMKTPRVRWKFTWADANEDLFDLTVKIDRRVLRSLLHQWEMRERKFEFQISILLHCLRRRYTAVLKVDL